MIALSGHPNTGKSTLFNRLTGARQKVANFHGVTVEKKEGGFTYEGEAFRIVDLPGMYSLEPSSLDEEIASSFVLGTLKNNPPPTCIALVLNSNTLERGLFLVSQFTDVSTPVVVILNMVDQLRKSGKSIDIEKLSQKLGVPVVGTVASSGEGINAVLSALKSQSRCLPAHEISDMAPSLKADIQACVDELRTQLGVHAHTTFWAKQLIADIAKNGKPREGFYPFDPLALESVRTWSEKRSTLKSAWSAMVHARHTWARSLAHEVISTIPAPVKRTPQDVTDAIDKVTLHPIAGPLIFLGVMGCIFQAVYTWAVPLMDMIDAGVGLFSDTLASFLPEGLIQSFVVDGLISGVGNVLIFVPQIMILFGLITILEDSGYLARASFLLDRLLVKTGLSGKSFIPLLSSFACAVPGIMATRHIENRKERLMTIMIAPLMTCSARLPVYALFVGAFIPSVLIAGIFNLQGLVFLGLYLLGITGAVAVAFAMKKTLRQGGSSFFVVELPLYSMPGLKTVFRVMVQRGKIFIFKAGKIIMLCTVVLWFLAAFPRNEALKADLAAQGWEDNAIQAEVLRQSAIGHMGRALEPIIAPLGFDWKMGVGLISSFAAREVMVSTMATLYSMGDADEESVSLRQALREDTYPDGRPVFSVAVALSLLVFFVFAMQCMSTLAIVKRETNSWTIPTLMFVYMTLLAYGASFLTYQLLTVS